MSRAHSTSTAIVLRAPAPLAAIRSYDQTLEPTQQQYAAFAKLFGYFNDKLFGGDLRQPMLTFSRRAKSLGFFNPDNWKRSDGGGGGGGAVPEIALNPDHFDGDRRDVLSTLAHEMGHLWQHVLGKDKPSRAYHNQEFAARMESVGLMQSSTGKPGGKRTGQKMRQYIIPGGAFERAFLVMPDEWFLPFVCEAPETKASKAKASKTKFQCPTCSMSAWGKPDLRIDCHECSELMVPAP